MFLPSLACSVRFRLGAKLSETEVKFFSHQRETEGFVSFCSVLNYVKYSELTGPSLLLFDLFCLTGTSGKNVLAT
jgi:hypothetical protein